MPGPFAVFALEHRVEVSNQQNPGTGARMPRDEMSRAMERRAVHPLRPESDRLELGAEDPPDLADAGEILSAAVDVDDPLEQRERLIVMSVHVRDDGAFLRRERRTGGARLRAGRGSRE